jgi:hypothetical protein
MSMTAASVWAPAEKRAVPTGMAVAVPHDITSRRLAEGDHNVFHWIEIERCGHFLARSSRRPDRPLRRFFAPLR